MLTQEVTDKLPKAPWKVQWHGFWFRRVFDSIRLRHERRLWPAFYLSSRNANAQITYVGPLCVIRPMPWLEGPARSLHPELFKD